jgi:hypothetical protein
MSKRAAAGLAVLAAAVGALLVACPRSRPAPAGRDWTSTWRSEPPVVSTTPGGLLEAATVRMLEDFYRSDSRTWWGVYLGSTVSHIQASATYRYAVPLDDPAWQIVTREQTCVVVAPVLRPSLPVAIDTATLRERTESGWARFDKRGQLDDLRRSMSAELEGRARDPARMALAREAARRTVAEYVEDWLLSRGEWQEGVFSSVKVYFLDEIDEGMTEQMRTVR